MTITREPHKMEDIIQYPPSMPFEMAHTYETLIEGLVLLISLDNKAAREAIMGQRDMFAEVLDALHVNTDQANTKWRDWLSAQAKELWVHRLVKPTWKNTLNTRAYASLRDLHNAAKMMDYPYFVFNDKVYHTKTGNDTTWHAMELDCQFKVTN